MAFTIEQKIGKHVYMYEVESRWDPEKKQARQKRRYLGKKDGTTGEIISPQKGFTPRACRDYGHMYVLRRLAENTGLGKVLREVFPGSAELLMSLACFHVAEGSPLYLFRTFLESNFTMIDPEDGASQRLSELMERLGRMDHERELFFRAWLGQLKSVRAVIFDITSLSSHSKLNDFMEWGYNRDEDKLPQVNFGVVFTKPVGLPLAYRLYPGSIPDVSTLSGTVAFLKDIGMNELFFVLDRGFSSERNIIEMAHEKIRFVIPMPFTSKAALHLVSKNHKAITLPRNGFCFQDHGMFHLERPLTIGGDAFRAHLYFDEKRRADEVDHLIRRLSDLESTVSARQFRNRYGVMAYMEEVWKGASRFFSISVDEGRPQLHRKDKALSRRMNRMGHMVLLTNDEASTRDELLLLYRRRDAVEHLFDIMKNELRENRLRVSTRTAMEGRLFLIFLSLILYSALDTRMREKDLYRKLTVAEVLAELKKLRLVEMTSGRRYLTEVSKRQRLLFEALNVPIPMAP